MLAPFPSNESFQLMRQCLLIMSMGWDYISELWPPTGLLFIHRWYMSMEYHDGMILAGENSWFAHHSSLVILPAESKAGGTGKGNDEFGLRSIFVYTSKGFLTCCKIVRHGASGFTSCPKEGMPQIFNARKNASPSGGFEPTILGHSGKHSDHYITKHNRQCLLAPATI
jgi:hypothetical protein